MEPVESGQRVDDPAARLATDADAARRVATTTGATGATPAGPAPPAFIYAIGRVEPRFPSLAVEKEFTQVLGRGASTAGATDREALQQTLADRSNRYLARQLCWVFLVEGLETYILVPRDPADLELLVRAVRAEGGTVDVDVVVGQRGPLAPPEFCGGLYIPVVFFDQIWSFSREELLAAIPEPEAVKDKKRFETMAGELFDRVMQLADNAGATDQHRALNYLAVRYPAIYALTAEAYANNASLSGVEVRPSRLAGARNIVDVVFAYTHRETDVTEQYFVRVDVTEEFPFLVSRLAPYYDR